jgi:hypothetical protein
LRFYEPELHRLRGESLIRAGAASTEAERAFREAVALAESQRARFLELRARIGLSRLLVATGQDVAARLELAAACEGWAEVNETPDLSLARAALQSLGMQS